MAQIHKLGGGESNPSPKSTSGGTTKQPLDRRISIGIAAVALLVVAAGIWMAFGGGGTPSENYVPPVTSGVAASVGAAPTSSAAAPTSSPAAVLRSGSEADAPNAGADQTDYTPQASAGLPQQSGQDRGDSPDGTASLPGAGSIGNALNPNPSPNAPPRITAEMNNTSNLPKTIIGGQEVFTKGPPGDP